MYRRTVLQGMASGIGLAALTPYGSLMAKQGPYQGPVVDAHIHLFDPRRPQGIPWPEKGDSIFGPALPANYFFQASPLGIRGAIAVEASPWEEDNFWLLDTVKSDPRMIGFVGNLPLGEQGFAASYKRLEASPLFLGTRYGNLWDRDLGSALQNPAFISDMRTLSQGGHTLDSANPDSKLLRDLLHVVDRVPDLRIMINHLPNADVKGTEESVYHKQLAELAKHPQVFMKLSEIPRKETGTTKATFDLARYRAKLEVLWELFGEDRTVFGSDWPNSDHQGSLSETVSLARRFLDEKSSIAQKKVLLDNSMRFYRWGRTLS